MGNTCYAWTFGTNTVFIKNRLPYAVAVCSNVQRIVIPAGDCGHLDFLPGCVLLVMKEGGKIGHPEMIARVGGVGHLKDVTLNEGTIALYNELDQASRKATKTL